MMRPNKVGWGLVALFFIGGIFFWVLIPEIFIGQIWTGVAVLLALYYVRMNRRSDEAQELKRTGIAGRAQIIEMTQTGTYINEQPRVKLKLRIEAPGVAPFEDDRTETVPLIALGRLSSGVPLTIYLKPEDPSAYVIDWFGGGAVPTTVGGMTVAGPSGSGVDLASNPDAQRAIMQALREHGVDTSSGSVDLRQAGAAREAVLEALREHGIDVAHQVAARDPSTPIEDKGESLERMMKLQQLRDADLISADEFEQYRKRILEEL